MEEKYIKLTSAVYKLLDFFPEGEPLKNRAKDKLLEIVEGLTSAFNSHEWVSFKDYLEKDHKPTQIKLLEDIEVLLNYLKLAKLQSWIDNVNFLIISKEFEKIKDQFSQISKEYSSQLENRQVFAQTKKVTFQKTIENQVSFPKEYTNQPHEPRSEFFLSNRQNKILQFLKEKGRAQVSDLTAVLANVTKRTIRRDLDELLKNQKISRIGEFNQVFYQIWSNDRQNSDRTHLMS